MISRYVPLISSCVRIMCTATSAVRRRVHCVYTAAITVQALPPRPRVHPGGIRNVSKTVRSTADDGFKTNFDSAPWSVYELRKKNSAENVPNAHTHVAGGAVGRSTRARELISPLSHLGRCSGLYLFFYAHVVFGVRNYFNFIPPRRLCPAIIIRRRFPFRRRGYPDVCVDIVAHKHNYIFAVCK